MIRRNEDNHGSLRQMRPVPVRGFYHVDCQMNTLPNNCNPVRYRKMDNNSLWTHGKYAPRVHTTTAIQPGLVVENNIMEETSSMLKIGSNGSVLLREGKASCAWILHHSDHSQLKACYLLEQMSSLSSYRSELEGIYRGLNL